MKPKIKIILILMVWLPALLIALAIHYWLHLNLWLALALVTIGWVANGFLAEWEDRRPGGFSIPSRERAGKAMNHNMIAPSSFKALNKDDASVNEIIIYECILKYEFKQNEKIHNP